LLYKVVHIKKTNIQGETKMQTNAPKSIVWLIAVILGALGIVGAFVAIPVVSAYTFWLVTAGFVLLALATVLKGM